MWISVVWTEDCSSPCTSPWFVWQVHVFQSLIQKWEVSFPDGQLLFTSVVYLTRGYLRCDYCDFFWPLVSLLMLLGYVACRGFLVVRSIAKRSKINSQRERHVKNGNNDVDKADSLVANLKSTHDWFMKLSGKKKIRIYFGVSISFRKYFSLLVISNRSRLRILFL